MKKIFLTNITLLALIIFTSVSLGQPDKKIVELNVNAIGNLKTAILSENPGLRKSGIYLAGKYVIDEVADELVQQLSIEKDPTLKIMLMRVLYIIDDEKYLNDILKIALNDENIRVKKMATAIYTVMKMNKFDNYTNIE